MADTFDCSRESIEKLLASLRRNQSGLILVMADARHRDEIIEQIGEGLQRPIRRMGPAQKYIGETEKNLARVFDRASEREAILFFDEADALFGKRTSVKDSHDRYANQEVEHFIKRLSDLNGLWLLAIDTDVCVPDGLLEVARAVVRCSRVIG